jgi:hypothetical protein
MYVLPSSEHIEKYVRLTLHYFKRNLFKVEKVAEDFNGIFNTKKLLSPLGI